MSYKLLNIGCGNRFHKGWTNIDFISNSEFVIEHNLLNGIPYDNDVFHVVYHSHVLEHFNKEQGKKLLKECFRVLKKDGIIRIAVPDLELIIKEYTKNLELASNGDEAGQENYEWIILELFDQMTRNVSGGEMMKYITQKNIPNQDYVFKRIGIEGENIRVGYLNSLKRKDNLHPPDIKIIAPTTFTKIKNKIKEIILTFCDKNYIKNKHFQRLGEFRESGEIHKIMYDRYSLSKLLNEIGFSNISIKSAFDSDIINWNEYELEYKKDTIFKPDSLFIEAYK